MCVPHMAYIFILHMDFCIIFAPLHTKCGMKFTFFAKKSENLIDEEKEMKKKKAKLTIIS